MAGAVASRRAPTLLGVTPEQGSNDVTPNHGTVYKTRFGPSLYVRSERRSGDTAPQHLFVHVSHDMIYQHWVDTVPPEAELIIDEGGRKLANEERWLRHAAEHDIEILFGILKQACEWLPPQRAQELRRQWVETRPPKEDV